MTHDSTVMTHDSTVMTHDSTVMTHDSTVMTHESLLVPVRTRRKRLTLMEKEMFLCKHCDHFIESNPDAQEGFTAFLHLDDGNQKYDHDAEPGEDRSDSEWFATRPDLFIEHEDGRIGPNSQEHHQRGKITCDPTPSYCPCCVSRNFICMTTWTCISDDDPGNRATLNEYQCQDCNIAFWL